MGETLKIYGLGLKQSQRRGHALATSWCSPDISDSYKSCNVVVIHEPLSGIGFSQKTYL